MNRTTVITFCLISIAEENEVFADLKNNGNMKGVKKQDLPEKLCVTCGRPFVWRKK